MSDIEEYLAELRSHLSDLAPKRAEEIVAEARTHLELRVTQLRAGGMGGDDAMAEAVRTFGQPGPVAQELVEGNAAHRRPSALRVLAISGAFFISFGTAFALVALNDTPASWNSPSLHFIARHTGLALEPAAFLLMVIQLLPAAYVAGLAGGPRFWWLAGAPGAFWIGFCWTISLVNGSLQPYATLTEQLRWALILPGLAALVLAGTGRLAASLASSRSRPVRRAGLGLAVVCAAYAVSVGLVALGHALDTLEAQSIAAVVAVPTVLAFLVAARRDHRLSRGAFLLLCSTVSIAALLAVGAIALFFCSIGVTLDVLGTAFLWLAVAAGESLLGLLAMLVYAARTGRWLAERASPSDSGPAAG